MAFYELRQYKVLPGKMDEWSRSWSRRSSRSRSPWEWSSAAASAARPWLRRFESEAEREAQYKGVYESDHWKNEIAPRVSDYLDRSAMVVTRIVPTAKSAMR